MSDSPAEPGRVRVRVRGVVQGVGFRPFVYELAGRLGLSGWVCNDEAGVSFEAQGDIDALLGELQTERWPPLSRVDSYHVEYIPIVHREAGFHIRPSTHAASVSTNIGVDTAPCDACLRELFDPRDRRYRYPFLNCTHCGPRFSITRTLPYDRARTSMSAFVMCEACAREYHDPRDRRFHAQPTACPACGPRLSMPLPEIAERLRGGQILAIKGVGGFQLTCDARAERAVLALRARKERSDKPFAVMFASLADALDHAMLDAAEIELLTSNRRPIVLARAKAGSTLASSIAPGLAWVGVMLPASPLHYLIFHELAGRPDGIDWQKQPTGLALVMTSANPGGQPLIVDDAEASKKLDGIADAIVGHDRAIVVRQDDPVVRVNSGKVVMIRRGRGQVPEGIALAESVPCVLATGAFLKNAICMTRGDRAFLSQHIGDMDDAETYQFFEEVISHFRHVLDVDPVAVAHDLHPDFASTHYADRLGIPAFAVQHHHAHVAAVLAEHRRLAPTLGLALDGFGLGEGKSAWGGELLYVNGARFDRVGHLRELPMPGGDVATREPWRMAAAVLHRLGATEEIEARYGKPGAAVLEMLRKDVRCPLTTSCGRWFDAACALLGVRDRSGYEGEAPMVLESLATRPFAPPGGFAIDAGVLDLLPLFSAMRTMSPQEGADAFHGTLAAGLVALTLQSIEKTSADRVVVLSGGCLVNGALLAGLLEGFRAHDVQVLTPEKAPPGDGGLALGQAWVLAQKLKDT